MRSKTFKLVALAIVTVLLGGTVWAATITDFVTGNPVYAPDRDNAVFVISNKLDFGDIDDYANSGVTSSDVVQLLDIPAGMVVKNVGLRINTAWGAAGNTCYGVTIGDGTDPNGWITAVDFGPTSSGVSRANGAYHLVTTDGDIGKYYSATDTIDAVIPEVAEATTGSGWSATGLTDFVVEVWAEGIMAPGGKNYGAVD